MKNLQSQHHPTIPRTFYQLELLVGVLLELEPNLKTRVVTVFTTRTVSYTWWSLRSTILKRAKWAGLKVEFLPLYAQHEVKGKSYIAEEHIYFPLETA